MLLFMRCKLFFRTSSSDPQDTPFDFFFTAPFCSLSRSEIFDVTDSLMFSRVELENKVSSFSTVFGFTVLFLDKE